MNEPVRSPSGGIEQPVNKQGAARIRLFVDGGFGGRKTKMSKIFLYGALILLVYRFVSIGFVI